MAQIDLTELPPLEDLKLPKSGSLFIFYDNENQPWGFDPADASGSKVIYVDAPLSSIPLREIVDTLREEDRFPGITWTGNLEQTYGQLDGEQIRALEITEDEFMEYLSLSVFEGTRHRIGGHPDQIQNDVRLEVQLVANGIYCGNGDVYNSQEALQLAPGAEEWQLLLQIDSEESASMMWGDMGRLYFWIRKADLANRNFDSVRTILQCG